MCPCNSPLFLFSNPEQSSKVFIFKWKVSGVVEPSVTIVKLGAVVLLEGPAASR